MANDEPATIRLVVNADDFGLDPEVSRSVIRAHVDGVVTSTSVVGNCRDVVAAQKLLHQAPGLGVGAHLVLVGGAPVAPANSVRSLLGADDLFPATPGQVALSWAKGKVRSDELEREFDAQVERLRGGGLKLDHLSTRHHLGFLPAVGRAVETVARRHRIPGIRMAMEQPQLSWMANLPRGLSALALGGLALLTRRQMGALRHGPQTWGYVENGELDEIRILEILGRLGPGSHELICHPASELNALTSNRVRQAIDRRRIQLCRWQDLF
jgi:chitin disaccharide deacetylase